MSESTTSIPFSLLPDSAEVGDDGALMLSLIHI